MPTVKLTQNYINSLPVPEKAYWILDEALTGLRLYVGRTSKTYYIKYKNSRGKSDNFKIGDERLFTPIQAREAAKKILAEMSVSGADIKAERKIKNKVTVNELRKKYKEAGGASYTYNMSGGFKDLLERPAESLTVLEMKIWREKEKEKTGNKDKTLNHKTSALGTILNFGVDNDLLQNNPLAKLKPLKEVDSDIKTRYLTDEERPRFMKALDEMDKEARKKRERSRQHSARKNLPSMQGWTYANYFKPLILVSLNTGIRRRALLALKWEDVNLIQGFIILNASKAKARKGNIIQINDTVISVLEAWKKQRKDISNPLIFPSPKGDGVMNSCDSSFAQLLKKAGITNFTWHDMRHDFASRLAMRGVDLNTIRELMTHSDIKMTLRYAHLAPSKTKTAVNLLCE